MIVDDDEVGSKRLISYKIYGCQENKAGYLLSDIYSSENSDATIIFLCIFPFTEGLKILGAINTRDANLGVGARHSLGTAPRGRVWGRGI